MTSYRIPSDRQTRFDEVSALLDQFGRQHPDSELTGFTVELYYSAPQRHGGGPAAPETSRIKPAQN
jgi:hypothetical protein